MSTSTSTNPKPSSLNRRVPTHRRVAVRARSRANVTVRRHLTRDTPTEPVTKQFCGVVRGRTIGSKKAKKIDRNKNYATERKKIQMAEELLKKQGEVEMADAATVKLSKRQQKLADRAQKNADDNAKAKVAIAKEKAEKEKEKAEKAAAAGEEQEAVAGDMDLDI